jgi:ABC-type oligopeptide transport system substrate-binding subunit
MHVVGDKVHFSLRADAGLTPAQFVGVLDSSKVVSAAVGDGGVWATFVDKETAQSLSLDSYLVKNGPYSVESYEASHLVLRAKAPARYLMIDVRAVGSEAEEWRRFMAGEFDILPELTPEAARHLTQVPSVRVVPVENPASIALYFRCEAGPAASVDLRRTIAHSIHSEPLAAITGGRPLASFSSTPEGHPADSPRLRLIVASSETAMVRMAIAVQQQLAIAGIDVRVDALDLRAFAEAIQKRDFDMYIFIGGATARYWPDLQGSNPRDISGYSSPSFDAAMSANDASRAMEILEADVPVVPLVTMDEVVVTTRAICNVHPHDTNDYTWLADVHWCAPGEVE